jgi:hypothetical protein
MAPSDESAQQERRAHPRRIVCIVAHVEPEELPRDAALLRNISLSGAYLLARLPMSADERVLLALHFITDKGEEARVEEVPATVIRVEPLDAETSAIWSVGVAMRFEASVDHLTDAIERAASFAASVGYDR